MTNKKKTNRQLYNEQISRIRKIYNSLDNKEGVYLNKSFEDLVGTTPKRVTQKSIQRLKQLHPKDIRKGLDAEFIDLETGKSITYNQWKSKIENPTTLNSSTFKEPTKMNSSIPTLSRIDSIHDKIDRLPNAVITYLRSGVSSARDMGYIKSTLHAMVDNNYEKYGEKYLEELDKNAEEINEQFTRLDVTDMYEEEYTESSHRLQMLLNFNQIFINENENSYLFEMQRYFNGEE